MLRRLPIDFAKVKAGNRSDILLNKIRKMALIGSAISLQLKWSKNCILVAGTAPNQNPYLENVLNNQNLVLKDQPIGINIYLKRKMKGQTNIQIF